MKYPDLFKKRYKELKGKRWILNIDPDDLKAWVQIGHAAAEYGRKGGKARAASAKRDSKGRFA